MSTPRSGPDRDRDPQEPSAGHREPCIYVTEISVPFLGDGGVQRLHARMKDPGPNRMRTSATPGSRRAELVGITIGQESAAARATSEDTVTALHEAIGVMSFICDYAQSGDAQGFNAADAYEGAPPQF